MEIFQLAGVAMVGTVMAVMLKYRKPEMAVLLSLTVGIIIFWHILNKIGSVVDVIRELSARADVSMVYLGIILKIVGIAYIADFTAQMCRDAEQGAIAAKVELAAKVLILVLSVPIVIAVLQSLLKLIP